MGPLSLSLRSRWRRAFKCGGKCQRNELGPTQRNLEAKPRTYSPDAHLVDASGIFLWSPWRWYFGPAFYVAKRSWQSHPLRSLLVGVAAGYWLAAKRSTLPASPAVL